MRHLAEIKCQLSKSQKMTHGFYTSRADHRESWLTQVPVIPVRRTAKFVSQISPIGPITPIGAPMEDALYAVLRVR